ncbi:hypothetical protein BG015_008849 [Linnemannia schmuckeri]|uniref:Uncharacterized protein n=1 Tax=Linnemannia schmuckeri TaxID=64567 RepID=A0A9P5S5P0_9FUNG|nr:hypothetical protein BG015_008849 [Linnemannia schmuckeri]
MEPPALDIESILGAFPVLGAFLDLQGLKLLNSLKFHVQLRLLDGLDHAPTVRLDPRLGDGLRLQLDPSLQDEPSTHQPYDREDNAGLQYEATTTQDPNF